MLCFLTVTFVTKSAGMEKMRKLTQIEQVSCVDCYGMVGRMDNRNSALLALGSQVVHRGHLQVPSSFSYYTIEHQIDGYVYY